MSFRTRMNINLVLLMAVALALGPNSTGGAAPWPNPAESPVTVAYAIDGSIAGVQALGKTNPGVIPRIQTVAGANNYREVDVTTSKTLPTDVDWSKSAWAALDKSHPPQWTASGPRGGWASKALPTNPDDAEKALKGIMRP